MASTYRTMDFVASILEHAKVLYRTTLLDMIENKKTDIEKTIDAHINELKEEDNFKIV